MTSAAFDGFAAAVERAHAHHRRRAAAIEFWHRCRMALLLAAILAEPAVQFVVWAWRGFPAGAR